MDVFHTLTAARLIFVLGIVNLTFGTLVFLSCRCLPGFRITGRLMKYQFYRKFFKLHCYCWPILWLSVITHAVFALKFYGGWPG